MFSDLLKLAAAALCLASCSVLEDRNECPCFLTLDLSSPANNVCDSLLVMVNTDNFSISRTVGRKDYARNLVISIPSRHHLSVNVVEKEVGREYSNPASGALYIPEGDQCPRAYMCESSLDAGQAELYDKVSVRKNYCGVTLNFSAEDLDRYRISILGNVCGYHPDGSPMEGEFLFLPLLDNPLSCYFQLPRQKDASLRLGIALNDAGERYFSLGKYIEMSGYDWNKRDLDDIVVNIDFVMEKFTISINGWNVEEHSEIVL